MSKCVVAETSGGNIIDCQCFMLLHGRRPRLTIAMTLFFDFPGMFPKSCSETTHGLFLNFCGFPKFCACYLHFHVVNRRVCPGNEVLKQMSAGNQRIHADGQRLRKSLKLCLQVCFETRTIVGLRRFQKSLGNSSKNRFNDEL
eukprot:TRINITY_DN114_c0_g1_i7.p2 TRINITY_DN114_c0_g1~~TRINITY_DN114_c0_g1_i7.p2  ORF type:complete len:143 (+),score=0.62 TRINITY_DN114_c0_g1_i7:467-895(+)